MANESFNFTDILAGLFGDDPATQRSIKDAWKNINTENRTPKPAAPSTYDDVPRLVRAQVDESLRQWVESGRPDHRVDSIVHGLVKVAYAAGLKHNQ